MNLYEYQAKKLFDKYHLPIPNGFVCSTLKELKESIHKIKGPWVGKCQIQAGGRGKSGGVKILQSEKEAEYFFIKWFGKYLITHQTDESGEVVHRILFESCVNIINELYFSIIIDRATSKIMCLVSKKGGVEIENIVRDTPYYTYKIFLDPLIGPQSYQGRQLGFSLGLNFNQVEQFTKIFMSIGKIFLTYDLILVEINPLVITENGSLLCLDAKISIDRNSLFRQKKTLLIENIIHKNTTESIYNTDILDSDLNYIPMSGNIGCMVNGAGLAMATMDLLSLYGGAAANFLDVGGDVTKESVIRAMKIIANNPKVKIIFINIFGGIVCCDLIAEGIIEALSVLDVTIPIIVRLEGNNAKLGNKKLLDSKYNIIANNDLSKVIQQIVLITNGLNQNVNFN